MTLKGDLKMARILEVCAYTGIQASGVIITPRTIIDFVPRARPKIPILYVTNSITRLWSRCLLKMISG